VQSPLRWSKDPSWKLDYSNIERLSPEEIRRRREEFDRQKAVASDIRDQPSAARSDWPIGLRWLDSLERPEIARYGGPVFAGLGRRVRRLARGKT
jgi:hypothetical protein